MPERHRSAALCGLALLASGATACADSPRSCDLDNSALVLRATASDLGVEGVEVEVELEIADGSGNGTGTSLALCPEGDSLAVNGVEAEEVHALGHLYYVVEFESREPSYEIVLGRKAHEDVSVLVEMPPGFEIAEPAEGGDHSRALPLAISWEPGWAGHMIELSVADEIGSTCIEGLGVELELDDTGSYELAANSLVGGSADGSCEVTLTLTRTSEAEYPSALAMGGSVGAIVRRRRSFRSTQ